jgi:phosphate starvation-inducible protein PhoH and related proteins
MEEIICPEELTDSLLSLVQKNLDKIETVFGIDVALRGNKIMFTGDANNSRKFRKYMKNMLDISRESNTQWNQGDFNMSLSMLDEEKIDLIKEELNNKVKITVNGKVIFPKTYNQREYIKAINGSDLTFGIGPAGTGKTFLAISMALTMLFGKRVERIVLTRPVVEAGEKLGFLPGDIQQKVNPYFRPIYDALYSLVGFEKTAEMIEKEIIEIAPLAYMRGRTIDNAFILLDEGQNTLNSQMKMFLTRFGQNSRVVITADTTQIDLPEPKKSGIFNAIRILEDIKGIRFIHLDKGDIVRHPLVQRIIEAYERKGDAL